MIIIVRGVSSYLKQGISYGVGSNAVVVKYRIYTYSLDFLYGCITNILCNLVVLIAQSTWDDWSSCSIEDLIFED